MLAILEIFFFKTCHVMYSFDRPICLFLTMFPFYPDQVSNRNAKLTCNSLDDRNSGMANFFFFFCKYQQIASNEICKNYTRRIFVQFWITN